MHQLGVGRKRHRLGLHSRVDDDLGKVRGLARRRVRPLFIHQFVERRPGDEFQNIAKDAIPVPHGLDPFRVPVGRKTPEASRIKAVRLSKHFPYRTAVVINGETCGRSLSPLR
jgi:hypothetical protein